jgi:hypothetical protein
MRVYGCLDYKFFVCVSVLGRCRLRLCNLRLEAAGDDPVVCRHRDERCSLLYPCPAYVVDLHRVNGRCLVAGSTGVLRNGLRWPSDEGFGGQTAPTGAGSALIYGRDLKDARDATKAPKFHYYPPAAIPTPVPGSVWLLASSSSAILFLSRPEVSRATSRTVRPVS